MGSFFVKITGLPALTECERIGLEVGRMSEHRVTVFSTPTCAPCRATKEFLSSKGIAFRDVNVLEDQEMREKLVRRTGQMAVPVILVDEEVVVGFDRGRLERLLGI